MADRSVPEELAAWAAVADQLEWDEPWTTLYEPDGQVGRWFAGGRLNLTASCVDRHIELRGDQPALFWEGEPGDRRQLTYRELYDDMVLLAGALRGMGVGVGDRVDLYGAADTASGRGTRRTTGRLPAAGAVHPGRCLAARHDPASEGSR
jgi:acetyl-CoA synthetase